MNEFEKKIAGRLKAFSNALKRDENIAETFNCRTVALDLKPTEYNPAKVLRVRKKLQASQAVFAKLLGASVNTVRAWEQGINPPNDMACRFMDEIDLNIDYWKMRLRSSVKSKTA